MTGYASPSSGGHDGDTHVDPFEQELVTALNDFSRTSPAPHFDATGIKSRTRRKRAGFIAAASAALIVVGGGTALATVGTGSHPSHSAAAHGTPTPTPTAVKGNDTTVPYVKPFDLGGMNLDMAKEALAHGDLTVGKVTYRAVPACKPGAVIAVSPLSPTVLRGGETVDLTLCR
ncbi:PASTA domain-containing protein [Streptomyces sp. NBC_00448]|uniref:PASTA domain-containing protein n=1 Tax=Streptomyces sp. NBC_00448 TaxID=2903652 RepID=UPI002E1B4863